MLKKYNYDHFDNIFGRLQDTFNLPTFQVDVSVDNYFENRDENGNLILSVDVPGIKEEDINIEMIDGVLSIKGERKTANSSYQVQKSIPIPAGFDTDKITAELKDGVLTLKITPKELIAPKEVKKIPISITK